QWLATTEHMTQTTEQARLLTASYNLVRQGQTFDLLTLCGETGLDVYRTLRAAWELQEAGLLVARTLRPTLKGVVAALRLTDPRAKGTGPVLCPSRSRRASDRPASTALGTLLTFPRVRLGADAA